MYQVGDLVVYGTKGVCRISDISMRKTLAGNEEKQYYTLEPVFSKGSVFFTPVDNNKVIIRTVISKDSAMELIDDIPNIELIVVTDDRKRENTYHDSVAKCDCRELVRMIKTLQQRKKDRLAAGKKVTSVDERYLHMAEDNLYSELSIPLQTSKQEVGHFIMQRVIDNI